VRLNMRRRHRAPNDLRGLRGQLVKSDKLGSRAPLCL